MICPRMDYTTPNGIEFPKINFTHPPAQLKTSNISSVEDAGKDGGGCCAGCDQAGQCNADAGQRNADAGQCNADAAEAACGNYEMA